MQSMSMCVQCLLSFVSLVCIGTIANDALPNTHQLNEIGTISVSFDQPQHLAQTLCIHCNFVFYIFVHFFAIVLFYNHLLSICFVSIVSTMITVFSKLRCLKKCWWEQKNDLFKLLSFCYKLQILISYSEEVKYRKSPFLLVREKKSVGQSLEKIYSVHCHL